ncbi:MAG: ABC transporter ATP-binding protein [Chloroflexota bacterium]|nr:ABC transporter ATP-binding protein [Chloroflexota bacterium]
MSQDNLVIEARQLSKIYHKGRIALPALRQATLYVRRGEFVAVMGPSGSGKSTLLNLLGCLDCPSDGVYYLEHRDVSRLSDGQLARVRNARIGFVFQTFNLLPTLSALRNVELPLLYRRRAGDACRRARAMLERVGLGTRFHHRPAELSGGECQRVAIARALVGDPTIILADEPTGNLDSATGAEVLDLLSELHSEGRTIVLVTHETGIARRADRVLWMRDGVLTAQGA